jgi:mycoketide-CoA synthase
MLAVDEHGRLVASAESVVVRKIAAAQLGAPAARSRDSLLHLEWVPVTDDEAPGSRGISLMSLDELSTAFEAGTELPDAVLLELGTGVLSGKADTPPAATRQLLELGLSLVQKWMEEPSTASSRLVILTSGAVAARTGEGVSDLAAAALWGLLRSVQSESPDRFVLVDLDDEQVLPDALRAVLGTDESQIALRGGEALVARLRRPQAGRREASVPPEHQQPTPEEDVPRSVGDIGLTPSGKPGTVLITGGTGALGGLLARHLVERHGVLNLMLVGRRGMQAPGADLLQAELEQLGAEVRIASCDVSNREELADLIDSLPDESPLSAVVHAAGALDDGVIEAMTPERLDHVLAPKAYGAWHLHELTEKLELSAFILFSSSTGTLGGPAQSNYAAANAFLDSLAAYRRERGLPCISMAWGWWAAAEGMAGDLGQADRARMERSGMHALSGEEGLELFDAAYVLGEPLVIPARLDTAGLRAQMRMGEPPPLLRGLIRAPAHRQPVVSLSRRLAGTPESERERVVLDLVRTEVASVLGHESADAIDPQRAFNELGLDSLAAVELRNRLGAVSGLQLPATLVFDHPTAAALAEMLLERISPELGGSDDRGPSELDIRNALASIPLARLREAGVMDTLMQIAGLAAPSDTERETVDLIDEMDLESLVQMTLEHEDVLDESEIRS